MAIKWHNNLDVSFKWWQVLPGDVVFLSKGQYFVTPEGPDVWVASTSIVIVIGHSFYKSYNDIDMILVYCFTECGVAMLRRVVGGDPARPVW